MFVQLHQLVQSSLRAAVLIKLLLTGRAPGRRPDSVYSRNANDANDANELCPSIDDEICSHKLFMESDPDSKEQTYFGKSSFIRRPDVFQLLNIYNQIINI